MYPFYVLTKELLCLIYATEYITLNYKHYNVQMTLSHSLIACKTIRASTKTCSVKCTLYYKQAKMYTKSLISYTIHTI